MRCVKTESALKNVGNQAQSVGGGGGGSSGQTNKQINSYCSKVRLCRGLVCFPRSCIGDEVFTRLLCVISATVAQILFGQKRGHTPCLTVDIIYSSNSISNLSVSLLLLRSEPSWLKLISTLLHNFISFSFHFIYKALYNCTCRPKCYTIKKHSLKSKI